MAYQAGADVEAAQMSDDGAAGGNGGNGGGLKTAKSYLQHWLGSKAEALEQSLHNRYLISNVVYAIYVLMILYVDLVAQSKANDDYGRLYDVDDDDSYPDGVSDNEYLADIRRINEIYVAAGVVHLINSFMYIWTWLPLGYGLFSVVMIPEYLNVLGASLYLYTATIYSKEVVIGDGAYLDDVTIKVHRVETAAAVIEVFAAFGWVWTWWLTYPRGKARGFTLDDPDLMANALIVAPSIMYLAYNAAILRDYSQYGANLLYIQADIAYAVGAAFYILAALRDDGWFESFWFFQWAWSVTRADVLFERIGGGKVVRRLQALLRLTEEGEEAGGGPGAGERTSLL